MSDDLETRLAGLAAAPRRDLDPQLIWREARRRRQRALTAATAGAASLVLLAGAALVAAEPGPQPAPVVDAPGERDDVDDGELTDDEDEPDETDPAPDAVDDREDPAPDASTPDASAPAEEAPAEPPHGEQLWGRSFVSVEVRDDERTYDLVDGTHVEVAFERRDSDDVLRWNAGCNLFGAPVEITADRLLVADEIGRSDMGCPDDRTAQDDWVRGFFAADPTWRVEGDRLTLRAGQATIELREGEREQQTWAAARPTRPLAKAGGFRDGLEIEDVPYALIEIAYDRGTAERAWDDNVPDDLTARDGEPAEPGRYGDLDEVDFDRQALIVWHAGESGTCPSWLAGLTTIDGRVHVEVATDGDTCTDDYRGYRMVLAVDRDQLPSPDELPQERIEGLADHDALREEGRVTTYPVTADGT